MLKSTEKSGSLKREKLIQHVYVLQKNYVVNVFIDLNVPNGVYITNDLASGVGLQSPKERQFVVNET